MIYHVTTLYSLFQRSGLEGGSSNRSQLKCTSCAWVGAAVFGGALSWRSTTLYVSIPHLCFEVPYTVFFSVLQYTSDVIVVHYCMNSTISTPFLSQKIVAIIYLADICLNFFGLFSECVCIHCFDCSLVSTFTNGTQVSSPVMWLRIHRHLCGIALKCQSRSHSLHFMWIHEHFQIPSCAKLVTA
jgi:hypothetical protein